MNGSRILGVLLLWACLGKSSVGFRPLSNRPIGWFLRRNVAVARPPFRLLAGRPEGQSWRTIDDDNNNNNVPRDDTATNDNTPAASLAGMLLSRRAWIVQTVVGGLLAIPLVGELYARSAAPFVDMDKVLFNGKPANSFPLFSSPSHLTLVFHGAGGTDPDTDALMSQLASLSSSNAIMVDWFAYSSDVLQASFNGQAIGRKVARLLYQQQQQQQQEGTALESIHIVGISVGAFAADETVAELLRLRQGNQQQQENERRTWTIQQTLLDPFCLRGALDWGYGKRNYGKAADYAQQYLNTVRPC